VKIGNVISFYYIDSYIALTIKGVKLLGKAWSSIALKTSFYYRTPSLNGTSNSSKKWNILATSKNSRKPINAESSVYLPYFILSPSSKISLASF
jgi:hypothetical protein